MVYVVRGVFSDTLYCINAANVTDAPLSDDVSRSLVWAMRPLMLMWSTRSH